MEDNNKKNRVLVFGGTGYIGKYVVKASISLGYPTLVYTRPINSQTHPSKKQLCKEFNSMGVTIVEGELEHDQIVAAVKQVDIVICTLPYPQVLEQLKIIDAIKVAGNIKRFLPSEFGVEEDRVNPLPPFQAFLDKKRKIRREIEAAGIPYTYISANFCGAYFVNFLLRPYDEKKNDITIYGNGEIKAVLNYEEDIGKYTIQVANDPRTHNRIVIYRPSKNIISQNELISLWEQKTGQNFSRTFVSEEEIVKLSQTLPPPEDIPICVLHSAYVRGDHVFELGEDDLEASQLYPNYNYTSIDELLDIFLVDPPPPASAAFG